MNTNCKTLSCSRCGVESPLIGIDCHKCHYTALVMLYVHKYWALSELEGLLNEIRVRSVSEMLKSCPVEAVLMRKIFTQIRVLSHPAGIHEDSLKSSVCEAILKYMGAMKGVANYEAANGQGSYMRVWALKLGDVMRSETIQA